MLPLTLPGIAATLGFVFTAAWSELLFALMLNSSTEASTFPVGLLAFVSKFSVDFGQMMAAGVLALIPVCVLVLPHPALSGAGPRGRRRERLTASDPARNTRFERGVRPVLGRPTW